MRKRARLPDGIALFQVTLPHRQLCYVDSNLRPTYARLARDAAAVLAGRGHAVVVLTTTDLERALEKARRA